MQKLNDLITAAISLAGGDSVAHSSRLWRAEGGRSCPIGWGDCGQTVFVDIASGEYDYGDEGGPGHAECLYHCPHGRRPPNDSE